MCISSSRRAGRLDDDAPMPKGSEEWWLDKWIEHLRRTLREAEERRRQLRERKRRGDG